MAETESDSDSDDGHGDRLKVAISGGSMGGLFTALALDDADRAVDVEIFERSTGELRSRGAGIVAQPTILDFLDAHDIANPEELTTTTTTRQYLDREGAVERAYEESMAFTSWDGLYRRLGDAVPDENYHLGRTTISIDGKGTRTDEVDTESSRLTNGGRGERATLRFENGEILRTDLAVVAEGGQSGSREELLPDVKPEYAGYVAWRGVTPEGSVSASVHEQFEDTFTFYEGSEDLVLAYLIPGPDDSTAAGERRLNWVWYDPIERGERRGLMTDIDGRTHDFSVPPGKLRADVEEALLAAAEERLPGVFDDLVRATDDRFVQTIYDLEVPRTTFGRVCLLGDSAFVARPHTAAGTAKAAADGIALADALEASDRIGSALDDWERTRGKAGRRLVAEGRRMGENYMH
ncbi:FAD-dependent monooxygenase [Halobacteriales archaeon QS_3_64_16]|nr:MAG: FAD-dependent monooxygenase [Halobacteriales archaeon QS_3_64_16]